MKTLEPTVASAADFGTVLGPYESDHALAQRASREQSGFAAIYQHYCERVYRYLLIRTGSIQDAQDLTSTTFMAALENLSSYRGEGTLAAWLLSIAYRKMIDHFRRSKRVSPLDEDLDLPHTGTSPEDLVERTMDFEKVQQALSNLNPERAEALSLRFFAGLAPREIAEVMGKTEPAVKMLVLRALQDLRGCLITDVKEED